MTVMIDSAGGQVRVDPLTGAISPVDTLARELNARGVDTFLEPLPNLNKAGRQWVSGDAPAVGFITTFAAYDAAVGSACHVQPEEYPKGGIVIVQAGFKPLDTMDEAIAAALRVLRGGLTALLSPVERWAGVNESVWDELLSAAGIAILPGADAEQVSSVDGAETTMMENKGNDNHMEKWELVSARPQQ